MMYCYEEKDLGVTFEEMLYNLQFIIQNIVHNANQITGLIKRTLMYLNKDIFIKLHKVRRHLE